MADPDFGPACPGCTPAGITARIERAAKFGMDMSTCRACRDGGALFHAQEQKQQRDREDATITTGRPIGRHMEAGRAES